MTSRRHETSSKICIDNGQMLERTSWPREVEKVVESLIQIDDMKSLQPSFRPSQTATVRCSVVYTYVYIRWRTSNPLFRQRWTPCGSSRWQRLFADYAICLAVTPPPLQVQVRFPGFRSTYLNNFLLLLLRCSLTSHRLLGHWQHYCHLKVYIFIY